MNGAGPRKVISSCAAGAFSYRPGDGDWLTAALAISVNAEAKPTTRSAHTLRLKIEMLPVATASPANEARRPLSRHVVEMVEDFAEDRMSRGCARRQTERLRGPDLRCRGHRGYK